MEYRLGRVTIQETEFIKANASRMSVEEIANKLKRKPEMVQKTIDKHVPKAEIKAVAAKTAVRDELRSSHAWKQLKEKFSPNELDFFEEKFTALVSQFRDDVLPTEETQIM